MLFLYDYLALIGNSQPQKMFDVARPIHHKRNVYVTGKKNRSGWTGGGTWTGPTVLMSALVSWFYIICQKWL